MQKGVLTGLFLLIVLVFAYVGYTSYAGRRSAPETYRDGMVGGRARSGTSPDASASSPAGSTLPANPATGDGGDGLVSQNGSAAGANGMVPPATDSIPANPPNGERFGGASGHYQLYRQGDLTWRLNTETGETCILFATDEEWRKPKVYKDGCRGK